MFFQRHLASAGQLLPPWTWTAMPPSSPSVSDTFFASYLGSSYFVPSQSMIFTSLIQVVIFAGLPTTRTRAVFQSFTFHAFSHSSLVQVCPTAGAFSTGFVYRLTSFSFSYLPKMLNGRVLKPPVPSP